MNKLTMTNLENCFNRAIELKVNYVGVMIELPNAEGLEVIINDKANFKYKLEYYQNTYNNDLSHKHVQGLKIIGFTYGNSFDDIDKDLAQ